MKKTTALIMAAAAVMAVPAFAEIYQDWTPHRGAWQITEVHVDANHVDDYLTGLRTTWARGNDVAKRHGVIDEYQAFVRLDPAGHGANVMLAVHYPSLAVLEPDQARDKAIQNDTLAIISKEKGQAMVAGYEKYRTFVDDGLWQNVEFAK